MTEDAWHRSACILCECNCGIEVRLGGVDGRTFERIRGDKAHPASGGYTCEKALRLDHYQNGRGRLTSPLRRNGDGTFDEIDWGTAISEIASRFANARDTWGGESIFYYGGGGQGNHLGGGYSSATRAALGSRYRSNALAQEKTGEFWVNAQLVGPSMRPDLEESEVAVFVGKNPWHSHGFARARTTLKEISRDENRSMIVLDPRLTETAALADFHLRVKPGTDAWCLAALGAVIAQEELQHNAWLDEHATGVDEVLEHLRAIDVPAFCGICGVDEELVRRAARRIASAASVGVFEDLGVQMGVHSTLSSYLEKLLWLLTGNLGIPGGQYIPTAMVNLVGSNPTGIPTRRSPVAGAPIISGLVPANVIAEEILTDHPARYRAMLIESSNPANSIADSKRMREALSSLDTVVVIDVAMTETARLADYVLPASSQFEKWEATFFNFEFPHNVFQLRRPLLDPLPGTLGEPEIHARLCEALGAYTADDIAPLLAAAQRGRADFADAFFSAVAARPELGRLAPVILYRALGPTLPDGADAAAVLWGAAHQCAQAYPGSVARAGFTGEGLAAGEALFDAILSSPSGLVFTVDEHDETLRRVSTDDGQVHLAISELLTELDGLATEGGPTRHAEFPLVLSAGERRSFTANTIIRDPAWRKRDADGSLRISPDDAAELGVETGDRVRVTTRRGVVETVADVNDTMQAGHISLPNGLGLVDPDHRDRQVMTGAATNELTASEDRDWLAGTPWHKHVPARVERVSGVAETPEPIDPEDPAAGTTLDTFRGSPASARSGSG